MILKDIREKESKIQRYAILINAEYQKYLELNVESMGLEQKRKD